MNQERVIEVLGLEPLPKEGGWFRRTFADQKSSAIYFLLEAGAPSHLHRIPAAEMFHHYLGAPAQLLILGPEAGAVAEPRVGVDLDAGERPQVVVPGGAWQAARTLGDWSLLGATTAPVFEWEDFELADRAALLARWPDAAEQIERHTA